MSINSNVLKARKVAMLNSLRTKKLTNTKRMERHNACNNVHNMLFRGYGTCRCTPQLMKRGMGLHRDVHKGDEIANGKCHSNIMRTVC